MKKIRAVVGRRPNYHRGQLLLEGDFLAEQQYHIETRYRHNLNLHGWGVVRGLTISHDGESTITLSPGVAIDKIGREIFLDQSARLDLTEFGPNEVLRISLSYEEAFGSEEKPSAAQTRYDCYAVVSSSKATDEETGVTLAIVRLDGQGKLGKRAVEYSQTRYARIAAGSITSVELHESLRKGWLRLPFRPAPMVEGPEEGIEEDLPAFRVGATEALSPDPKEAGVRDRGAAGTMAIPIPPSVKQVTRLRVAGRENEGGILLELIVGGWDPNERAHIRKTIVNQKITAAPFLETFEIEDTTLDPEYHTLALWLRGTRRTAISLIAVEFVY